MIPGLGKLPSDLTKEVVMQSTSRFVKGSGVQKKLERKPIRKDQNIFSHLNRRKLNQKSVQHIIQRQKRKNSSKSGKANSPEYSPRFKRERSNHSIRSNSKSEKSSNKSSRSNRKSIGPNTNMVHNNAVSPLTNRSSYSKVPNTTGSMNKSKSNNALASLIVGQGKRTGSPPIKLKKNINTNLKFPNQQSRPRRRTHDIKAEDLMDDILSSRKQPSSRSKITNKSIRVDSPKHNQRPNNTGVTDKNVHRDYTPVDNRTARNDKTPNRSSSKAHTDRRLPSQENKPYFSRNSENKASPQIPKNRELQQKKYEIYPQKRQIATKAKQREKKIKEKQQQKIEHLEQLSRKQKQRQEQLLQKYTRKPNNTSNNKTIQQNKFTSQKSPNQLTSKKTQNSQVRNNQSNVSRVRESTSNQKPKKSIQNQKKEVTPPRYGTNKRQSTNNLDSSKVSHNTKKSEQITLNQPALGRYQNRKNVEKPENTQKQSNNMNGSKIKNEPGLKNAIKRNDREQQLKKQEEIQRKQQQLVNKYSRSPQITSPCHNESIISPKNAKNSSRKLQTQKVVQKPRYQNKQEIKHKNQRKQPNNQISSTNLAQAENREKQKQQELLAKYSRKPKQQMPITNSNNTANINSRTSPIPYQNVNNKYQSNQIKKPLPSNRIQSKIVQKSNINQSKIVPQQQKSPKFDNNVSNQRSPTQHDRSAQYQQNTYNRTDNKKQNVQQIKRNSPQKANQHIHKRNINTTQQMRSPRSNYTKNINSPRTSYTKNIEQNIQSPRNGYTKNVQQNVESGRSNNTKNSIQNAQSPRNGYTKNVQQNVESARSNNTKNSIQNAQSPRNGYTKNVQQNVNINSARSNYTRNVSQNRQNNNKKASYQNQTQRNQEKGNKKQRKSNILCYVLSKISHNKMGNHLTQLKSAKIGRNIKITQKLFVRSLSEKLTNKIHNLLTDSFRLIKINSINSKYQAKISAKSQNLQDKLIKLKQLQQKNSLNIDVGTITRYNSNTQKLVLQALERIVKQKKKKHFEKIVQTNQNKKKKAILLANILLGLKRAIDLKNKSSIFLILKTAQKVENPYRKQPTSGRNTSPASNNIVDSIYPQRNIDRSQLKKNESQLRSKRMKYQTKIQDLIYRIQELKQLNNEKKYQVQLKQKQKIQLQSVVDSSKLMNMQPTPNAPQQPSSASIQIFNQLSTLYYKLLYQIKPNKQVDMLEIRPCIKQDKETDVVCQQWLAMWKNSRLLKLISIFEQGQASSINISNSKLNVIANNQVAISCVRSYIKESYLWNYVRNFVKLSISK